MRGGDDSDILPRILEALDRYVHGKGSLLEFETWFVPAAWDISAPTGSQTPLEALTAEVFLRIAENDMGHLPEPELRELLAQAADRARLAAAV